MKRALTMSILPCCMAVLCGMAALSGCATRALPAARLLPESRFTQAIVVGQTTKAQLQAALGPTTMLTFASGYEVWLYKAAAADLPATSQSSEREVELVILFDPGGVVKKTRRRDPAPPPASAPAQP